MVEEGRVEQKSDFQIIIYSNDTFHFGPRGLIPARSAVGVDEFDTLIQAMNEQSRKYAMSLMNSLPS